MSALVAIATALYTRPLFSPRSEAAGMHSALLRSRRQHYFIASLPADEQYAVSRLYSGSGADAKSAVKRIAVQVRRCASQLFVIQGSRLPNAFRQNQSRAKTSGRNVVGWPAELLLKTIEKPIRRWSCDVWEGHSGFPLARPEDSIRYLRKFSRKITEAGSNSRHYTNRAGPMLTSSHDAQFVRKGYC